MSDTKLREKADALIAFTQQGPRFIAWVQAVTDALAPAPVERSTDPNCGPYTHHWNFGFCHTCNKPGRDQGDATAPEKAAKVSAFPVGNCVVCGELVAPYNKHAKYEGGYTCQRQQPAPPDPAKVECPNCRQMVPTDEAHFREDGSTWGEFTCERKPAQPEPALPRCNGADTHDFFHGNCRICGKNVNPHTKPDESPQDGVTCDTSEPAAPEMPEAVCVNTFRLEELLKYADLAEVALRTGFHPPEFLFTPADRSLRQCIDAIKEERDKRRTHSQPQSEELNKAFDQGYEKGVLDEANRRTHSQPVAHPFKAGFKPDSMRHFAEYVRDNWHYFGTDTAGLAHQFLQEMAAQPVAVGMTEELEHILSIAERDLRYKEECFEDSARTEPDERIERLRAAIAAVRQQAAKVKL